MTDTPAPATGMTKGPAPMTDTARAPPPTRCAACSSVWVSCPSSWPGR